jgi:hypothetical protein
MVDERHQCQMFEGRTLPGVSGSRKRGKHGKGNSLLCQEGEREGTKKKGDGESCSDVLPLVICSAPPSVRQEIDS